MAQIYTQLCFFEETQEEKNAREIKELKAHTEKLRKSLYARNNDMGREIKSMKSDMEILIAAICKGKI